MRDTNHLTTTQLAGQPPTLARMAPLLGLLLLTLFPFGWLGEVWPALGRGIDGVFSTAGRHAVGHATLFFLLGLLALIVFPRLNGRPWRYMGLLLLAGVGQEFFQMLYKGRLMMFDNSRDLLTDLAGLAAAYALVWVWRRLRAGRVA
jgi:hypothetical protein